LIVALRNAGWSRKRYVLLPGRSEEQSGFRMLFASAHVWLARPKFPARARWTLAPNYASWLIRQTH